MIDIMCIKDQIFSSSVSKSRNKYKDQEIYQLLDTYQITNKEALKNANAQFLRNKDGILYSEYYIPITS